VADWWDHKQRWKRRWQRWRRRFNDWRAAWQRARDARKETRRMEDTSPATVPLAGVGRALLTKFDADMVSAITAAIKEEVAKEVYDAAVVEARGQLEQEFSDRRERLLDQLAREKTQIERDADRLAEEHVVAAIAEQQADWDERLQRQAWRDRAEGAEGVLADLVRQLIGPVGARPVYLFSRGVTSLRKAAVNAALAPSNLEVRSKASASERVVTVELAGGEQVAHTLFWLRQTPVEGVIDEDDADEATAP
jgi:hypothetical protein